MGKMENVFVKYVRLNIYAQMDVQNTLKKMIVYAQNAGWGKEDEIKR